MRIRFLTTYEPVSPFYRDLVPRLAAEGHSIEILVTSAEYRPGRTPLEQTVAHPNVRIRRIPCLVNTPNSALKKVWVLITYLVGCGLLTLFGRGADLNFFLTQPPFFSSWGMVLRLIRRQPYYCLIMDLYPDVMIAAGMLRRRSLSSILLMRLSRLTLRRAQQVIVIGRCMRDLILIGGVREDRVSIIQNWANETEIQRLSPNQNSLREQLELSDEFVCLYSGNIGVSHAFDDILNAALALKENRQITFVFIGGGSRRKEIEQFANANCLNNIRLLPYTPAEKLSEGLGIGDVHFVSLREEFVGLVVPSKAYGAMAAGKPIIYLGNSKGEIARTINENDSGAVVAEGESAAICNLLLDYQSDPSLLSRQSENAYQLSQTVYSRQSAIDRYVAVINRLK